MDKRNGRWLATGAVFLVTAILLATVAATPPLSAQTTSVSWQRELSSSLRLASSSRKWVLVDVYTDWCGWCKRMDRDTFANPQIVQVLNKSFVCVKADAEDGASGQAVANRYNVNSFPCILVLEPSGKLRGKIKGFRPPEAFYAALAETLKQ